MQTPGVVAAQHRVTSPAVNVHARTPRDQEPVLFQMRVPNALEPRFPLSILMDLIEPNQAVIRRPPLPENGLPVGGCVPVEVLTAHLREHGAGKRRFSALPRPADEYHLLP